MEDMREDIPQRAFINAQILQQLKDDVSFNAAVNNVVKHYNIPQYEFMNPAYVVSLLYCLLVVPRELFIQNNENVFDKQFPDNSLCKYFHVQLDSDNVANRSSDFLRRLRNSIAHARYSVDENMTFTFRDRKLNAQADEFVVTASADNLMNFLSNVGAFLANLRTRPR